MQRKPLHHLPTEVRDETLPSYGLAKKFAGILGSYIYYLLWKSIAVIESRALGIKERV